jgi:uncharacterized membrane protein
MIDPSNWVHSVAGGIHFACSVIGMLSGIFVLFKTKGTAFHRKIGYVFVTALVGVNLSALLIYDFNEGAISVFHFLIPVSLSFLGFGIIPMMGKRKSGALNRHIIGMNGAVLGLWAAGATEYFVREVASGLNKNELILYSFMISFPFAIAITVSIIYYERKYISRWVKANNESFKLVR